MNNLESIPRADRVSTWFSTWPPVEDVPAFRGPGAPGRRCALLVASTMAVLVGVAVLVGTLIGSATALDQRVSEFFAEHRTGWWNTVTERLSQAADTLSVILVGIVVVVASLIRKSRNGLIILTIGMLGELVMFLTITLLVSRARPAVPHLDSAPPTSSFPSGHTLATAVMWGSVAIVAVRSQWRSWLRRLLLALAIVLPLVIGCSRIYRGMHHPTDVLASLGLGVLWLSAMVRIFPCQTEDIR
jgi:membrane-associated phospholipid phosphatase